ncbi:hypothetical protein A9Q98_12130 [Thalassotalea sp. 42_200_T64]|nr:hypothetical protein A9Q98_12130 [Thalassotalea sp. 42_200_T64]
MIKPDEIKVKMEYSFRTDFITGQPLADFSYGHEAFGPWLEQEIGKDSVKLQKITDLIAKVMNHDEICRIGKEYTLTIASGEVEISANANHIDSELPDNLVNDVDDFVQDSTASCGLEDFVEMLNSWQEFI